MGRVCLSCMQRLAVKLTAQPCAASSCERNWSTFGFIHSKVRNRLQADRAADLVYVFSIMRLVSNSLFPKVAMVKWIKVVAKEDSNK